jgi:hypothetical protein
LNSVVVRKYMFSMLTVITMGFTSGSGGLMVVIVGSGCSAGRWGGGAILALP